MFFYFRLFCGLVGSRYAYIPITILNSYNITEYEFAYFYAGVLMYEMMAGRSPFDIVGQSENPEQNTEDYLFQGFFMTYLLSINAWSDLVVHKK